MMSFSLAKALRVQPNEGVAFVGAGGKSTAMFKLAKELPSPVIVTATTHLGSWQVPIADVHIIANEHQPVKQLTEQARGVTLITGEFGGDRMLPIHEDLLPWLNEYCRSHSIPLLIEADGSRQKPLKAWADHEPPIPGFVDKVVQVVGMSGLGKPLTDEFVHRAEIFSKLSGLKIGEPVSIDAVINVLSHEAGGLKNIPAGSRKAMIINQADSFETQSLAKTISGGLLSEYQSIVVANLKNDEIFAVNEPIAGIILAAGESSRFGEPKQLLNWKGKPFVRVVAETAIRAGLSSVLVVTGAHAGQIESAVQDLDVELIHNKDWKEGQASSIKSGLNRLPGACGGVIFLLADQPQVNTSILHALIEKHAEGLYPIIAPMVLDRRANPVLFDRASFSDLMSIEGDTGGRAIFHKHRVEYLTWHDDSLLLDVDTPEQYQRLINNEDL